MRKLLSILIIALMPALAFAQARLSTPPGVLPDASGTLRPYAAPHLVPVCNTEWNSEAGLNSSTGLQFNVGILYKCPRGAKSLAVLLAGFYMAAGELAVPFPLPINIGVWANAPGPYKTGVSYTAGQLVAYGSDPANGVAFWQAATTTSTAPKATNTDWAAYTPAATLYAPVTCNGGRACSIQSTVQPDGTAVDQQITQTDLIGVSIPANGYIYIKKYGVQSGVQKFAAGSPVQPSKGEYYQQSASLADFSVGNASANTYGGWNFGYRPLGIIGIPVTSGPTICFLSHSIGSGAAGLGFASPGTLTNGGTGYTAANVGVPFSIPNTGAGAFAVSSSAQWIIKAQSAGVVTSILPWFGGQYNNTGFNPSGGSPPSGAQTIVDPVLAGSGLIITPPSTSGGFDFGDADGYQGYLMRAANTNGIPAAALTQSSTSTAIAVTRDYSRLAAITALGCSTVSVDLAVNDLGVSLATAQANTLYLANQLYSLPYVKAVIFHPSGPSATSTDGFQLLANETGINTAALQAYNPWLRTQASASGPITCINDPYLSVSSSLDSGLWLPGGSGNINTYTPDGIHPSTVGYSTLATAEAPLMLACAK